jgi:PleD family two-component response regulator
VERGAQALAWTLRSDPATCQCTICHQMWKSRLKPGSVLIIDDDQDVSSLVPEVLRNEGFTVSELSNMDPATIWALLVGRAEPDVVLLDGARRMDYGHSWLDATWPHQRTRRIAAIMFAFRRQRLSSARAKAARKGHS